jgi:hypothetical protein
MATLYLSPEGLRYRLSDLDFPVFIYPSPARQVAVKPNMPLENIQVVAAGALKTIAAVDPFAAGGQPAMRWPANLIVDILMRFALYLK